MAQAKLSSKGQITIPQEVRERMGVSEGDRIEFVRMEDGNFLMVPKIGSIRALKGIIPPPKRAVTIEEMNAAIAAAATAGHKKRAGRKK